MPGSREKKEKQPADETYETRRAAFRAAKRDMKIPMGTQPVEVLSPNKKGWKEARLDGRNRRLYIFRLLDFFFNRRRSREIHIREDKGVTYPNDEGNQLDHFNAGHPPNKLKRHYFYRNRKGE
jgi:hypothetical protein